MKFRMKDFRRFHDTGDIEIKPITVLVGENSSGKSSFLAGLRYILETISTRGEASFNKEPFFLGAFDQIAHYRGGRFGRAKTFELGVNFEGDEMAPLVGPHPMRFGFLLEGQEDIGGSAAHITFENEQSQPTISRLRVQGRSNRLSFERKSLPKFTYQPAGSRQAITLGLEEKSDIVRVRGGGLNRNNITGMFETATDWAFRAYRESRRNNSSDLTDDARIARQILQSWYGIFALDADAVYSAAPFRTRPERTYSPIEATSSPEGAHVPISLAQAKSFEKNKWALIKANLEEFGQRSGMFKKIDIKRLGKLDSDPFQLIITVSKDRSNIVDVGYGVSQILPLIVETLINSDASFFLYQQPEVHLHPRGQAELGSYFIDFALKKKKFVVLETHSDYIIDRLRNDLVRSGFRPSDHLSLLYFEKDEFDTRIHRIEVADDGSITNPPDSYRQFFLEESVRTLGL